MGRLLAPAAGVEHPASQEVVVTAASAAPQVAEAVAVARVLTAALSVVQVAQVAVVKSG
jgi:hypothetical protein